MGAEATDLLTRSTIKLRCSDISVSGGYLDTRNPMDLGTPVWVRLVHGGHVFESHGKVAYAVPRRGTGVAFAQPVPRDQMAVLSRGSGRLQQSTAMALRQQRFALAYSLVLSAIRVCNQSALTLLS